LFPLFPRPAVRIRFVPLVPQACRPYPCLIRVSSVADILVLNLARTPQLAARGEADSSARVI